MAKCPSCGGEQPAFGAKPGEGWNEECLSCVRAAGITPVMAQSGKPDYIVQGNPGDTVFLVIPQNEAARAHLVSHVEPDAQWLGKGLAVEHRYIGDIVTHLEEDGFEVEL